MEDQLVNRYGFLLGAPEVLTVVVLIAEHNHPDQTERHGLTNSSCLHISKAGQVSCQQWNSARELRRP